MPLSLLDRNRIVQRRIIVDNRTSTNLCFLKNKSSRNWLRTIKAISFPFMDKVKVSMLLAQITFNFLSHAEIISLIKD